MSIAKDQMIRFLFFLTIISGGVAVPAIAQSSDAVAGIALYREGKYSEAIQKLEAVVAADKKDRQAQTYLAASYLQTKNQKKARSAFLAASKVKASKNNSKASENESVGSKTTYKITSKPRAGAPATSNRGLHFPNGKATLAVELLPDGTIGFIHIVRNNVPHWEPILINAARGIGFEPATENGKNVVSIITVEYSYSTF